MLNDLMFQGMTDDGFACYGGEGCEDGSVLAVAIVAAYRIGIQVSIEDQYPGAWQVRYTKHSKPCWYAVGDKHDEADLLRDLTEAIQWKLAA